MKRIGIFTLLIIVNYYLIAQESDTLDINQEEDEISSVSTIILEENDDEISIGTNEFIKVVEGGDTTKIKIGDNDFDIIEEDGGFSVRVNEPEKDNDKSTKRKKKFRGHWTGIDYGLNNFLNDKFSMSRSGDDLFMDLNTSRSWNINLNIKQYSIGFGSDRFGLLTGVGFEFNDYHFDGNNSIQKDSSGVIVTKDDYTSSLIKSKLSTDYLTVPLLLELQLLKGKRRKRIHITGGVIGGIKLGSHSKVIYRDSGKRQKDKSKDDFNISALRYGFTARVGYRALHLYSNYYPTPFFEKNAGPELYPFSVGLSFAF